MAKEKPNPKPDPKPDPVPAPSAVEERERVDPATGKKETELWRESVLQRLDGLAERVEAQGSVIQAWGMPPDPKPSPKPDTSDPEKKPPTPATEALDEYSN